ncbi:MAG: hypothetical protein ACRCT2_03380, partial [Plesiomonas shigelloides]
SGKEMAYLIISIILEEAWQKNLARTDTSLTNHVTGGDTVQPSKEYYTPKILVLFAVVHC